MSSANAVGTPRVPTCLAHGVCGPHRPSQNGGTLSQDVVARTKSGYNDGDCPALIPRPLSSERLLAMRYLHVILMTAGLWLGAMTPAMAGQEETGGLISQFRTPPDAARPWVYWFWLNGNITKRRHHRRPGGDAARGHRRGADHGSGSRRAGRAGGVHGPAVARVVQARCRRSANGWDWK